MRFILILVVIRLNGKTSIDLYVRHIPYLLRQVSWLAANLKHVTVDTRIRSVVPCGRTYSVVPSRFVLLPQFIKHKL